MRMKRGVVIGSGVVVGLAILVLCGLLLITRLHQTPWPHPELVAAQQTNAFPLYYPANLPEGFHYQPNSVNQSKEVVIYTLTFGENKKLFVSTVPVPKEVVFSDFYDRILNNKVDVLSKEGKAVIGNADGQTIGSLVTNKSWVTLNTKADISTQDLQTIVTSLRPL